VVDAEAAAAVPVDEDDAAAVLPERFNFPRQIFCLGKRLS
jgi:hypothetical protein